MVDLGAVCNDISMWQMDVFDFLFLLLDTAPLKWAKFFGIQRPPFVTLKHSLYILGVSKAFAWSLAREP